MEYTDKVYIALLPLLGASYFILFTFNYFALTWPKRQRTKLAAAKVHKSFVGIYIIEYWIWLTNPLVFFCKKLGISPNSITVFSLIVSIGAGYFYYAGFFLLAGWLLIFTGTLDLVDGRIARECGKSTNAGAFLDSCSDRYADAFIFLGIALYFIGAGFDSSSGIYLVPPLYFYMVFFSVLAIIGSEVMSYVKARGEAVGFTTKRGLMQRGERITMLAFFSLMDPFWRIIAAEHGFMQDAMMMVVIALMSVMINISALVRFIVLFKAISRSEKGL